ncbi:hypothetical protein SALBM217S_05407 [Streptomyces griseoloalbus]
MSLLELDGVKVHFPIKKGLLFDRTVGHVYAVPAVVRRRPWSPCACASTRSTR